LHGTWPHNCSYLVLKLASFNLELVPVHNELAPVHLELVP
jgi:hypothetical protein